MAVAVCMMKHLEKLLPFLNEGIDFIDIDKSIDLSRRHNTSLHTKYSLKQNPILGISLLSSKTPLSTVSLTGDVLCAGLGMEGEILAGLNAARSLMGD
jgi:hypothetical protein